MGQAPFAVLSGIPSQPRIFSKDSLNTPLFSFFLTEYSSREGCIGFCFISWNKGNNKGLDKIMRHTVYLVNEACFWYFAWVHMKCSFLLLPFCRLLLLAVKHLSDYFLILMKDPHQPISGSMFTVGYGRKCNLRLSNSSGGATICKLRQVDVRNSTFTG